jgi:hypothetical protein
MSAPGISRNHADAADGDGMPPQSISQSMLKLTHYRGFIRGNHSPIRS